MTSYTSSARLAGKFLGGLLAQCLVTLGLMNYHQLNYITISCIIVGSIFTIFLPNVKVNQQYYLKSLKSTAPPEILDDEPLKGNTEEVISQCSGDNEGNCVTLKKSVEAVWLDLKAAYGNSYVLRWSLWWAIASAGQYQVINYVQALWEKVREEGDRDEELYNGAVKAVHTFLSEKNIFEKKITVRI